MNLRDLLGSGGDSDGDPPEPDQSVEEASEATADAEVAVDPASEDESVPGLDEIEHQVDGLDEAVDENRERLESVRDSQDELTEQIGELDDTVRQLLGVYDQLTAEVNPFEDGDPDEGGAGFGVVTESETAERSDTEATVAGVSSDDGARDHPNVGAGHEGHAQRHDPTATGHPEPSGTASAEATDGGGDVVSLADLRDRQAEDGGAAPGAADDRVTESGGADHVTESGGAEPFAETDGIDEDLFAESDGTDDGRGTGRDATDGRQEPTVADLGVGAGDRDGEGESSDGGDPAVDVGQDIAVASGPEDDGVFLSDLGRSYATDVILYEWLADLLSRAGPAAALRALAYYEEVGWYDADVRARLETMLGGPGMDCGVNPETPSELTAEDHARSYDYVLMLDAVHRIQGVE